ncbi:hypothetical protein [Streptomyces sp. NPDC002172]
MQLAPSALHDIAGTLGGHFGWTVNELIIDDIVRLDGPHERQIAMRLTNDGSNIQLWAIGGVQHTDQESVEGIAPLPRGHHWNSWVHIGRLEADGDPATILKSAITEHLMPVFDTKPLYVGHRPWEEAFDSALSEVMAESTPPEGTSLRDCAPEAHTEPHDVGWEGPADAEPAPTPEPAAEPAEETAPVPAEQPAAQAVAEPPAESAEQPVPEPAVKPAEEPAAEPENPTEPPAKVLPIRSRRKPAAKVDTPAASDKPARPARKRTPAKKAADKPTS